MLFEEQMLILGNVIGNLQHYLREFHRVKLVQVDKTKQNQLREVGHLNFECSFLQWIPRIGQPRQDSFVFVKLASAREVHVIEYDVTF